MNHKKYILIKIEGNHDMKLLPQKNDGNFQDFAENPRRLKIKTIISLLS